METRQFLQSKSFLTLVTFCVLSVLASTIDSPWWEGKLLSLRPETPPGFRDAPPLITLPDRGTSDTVVDFSALHALSPEGTSPAPSAAASSEEATEALNEGAVPTVPETPPLPAFVPDPRDVALLDAMRSVYGPASNNGRASLLVIPCRQYESEQPVKTDADEAAATNDGATTNDVAVGEQKSGTTTPTNPLSDADSSANRHAEKNPQRCQTYALDNLFASLRARALGEKGLTRWSQYGDSLVVGDTMTGELRRLFQRQFGDGGHGFIFMGHPLRQFGFENIRIGASEAWDIRTIVRHAVTGGDMFGFGGAEFRPQDNSSLSIQSDPRETPLRPLEHFGLLYFTPSGVTEGSFRLAVDGEGRTERFETKPGSSAIYRFSVPAGDHRVSLSSFSPHLRYYGVISETSGPGVVVDNVGQVSSREEHLLKINPSQWQSQIALRDPTLIAFFYGVNAAGTSSGRVGGADGEYALNYGEVLRRAMANAPQRDCLVMSLLTRGTREGGEIRPTTAVDSIRLAQRAAASAQRCAFFDTTAVMGGADGIRRWADRQLLGADLAHPTGAGYREIARRLHTDVMRGFVDYLERRVAGYYEANEVSP